MNQHLLLPIIAWPLLTVTCVTLILLGLNSTLKRTGWGHRKQKNILLATAVFLVAWMVTLLLLSDAGFFGDFSSLPPRPLFAMLFPLPFVVYFAFSKTGSKILQLAPPQWLILIQSFRIPVEILLWVAFLNKQLPANMTFEGRNFDVWSGILALATAYFLIRRVFNGSIMVAIYNGVGLILLLNILIIAVLSMPTSFRYF